MPRPRKMRWIHAQPGATIFKPKGIPMLMLEQVDLEMDEVEALRLADLENLSQENAAEAMQVSRATFGRIVARARQKTADALIHGKVIRIIGDDAENPQISGDFPPGGHGAWHGCGRGRRGCGRGRWI